MAPMAAVNVWVRLVKLIIVLLLVPCEPDAHKVSRSRANSIFPRKSAIFCGPRSRSEFQGPPRVGVNSQTLGLRQEVRLAAPEAAILAGQLEQFGAGHEHR